MHAHLDMHGPTPRHTLARNFLYFIPIYGPKICEKATESALQAAKITDELLQSVVRLVHIVKIIEGIEVERTKHTYLSLFELDAQDIFQRDISTFKYQPYNTMNIYCIFNVQKS